MRIDRDGAESAGANDQDQAVDVGSTVVTTAALLVGAWLVLAVIVWLTDQRKLWLARHSA